MAIRKKVPDNRLHSPANTTMDVTQPAFSYPPTDALAQVIIDAWANPQNILDRQNGRPTQQAVTQATQRIRAAGLDLERAVIITEEEHDHDYAMENENEVVFVLPNRNRVIANPTHLLDTAKFLMACTPNGI